MESEFKYTRLTLRELLDAYLKAHHENKSEVTEEIFNEIEWRTNEDQ